VDIGDGLDVGMLDEVGIDTELIEKAVDSIYADRYGEVHSILIFKDGTLVLEEYFTGHKYQYDGPNHHGELVTWDRTMLHNMQSVTKSITSACVGIAIDHGFIQSVNHSIFDYLPEHQHLNTGGKDRITIEHLLTMTSGLEWDEWGAPLSSTDNDLVALWAPPCEDPVTCILERPLVDEPGTSFTYSGGGMTVLGEIIKNSTNMRIDEFSGEYLFNLLGIDTFDWAERFENGVVYTGGGLYITPRDMVKLGVTFLNKGVWDGKQIISEQWVGESVNTFAGNQGINPPGGDSRNVGYSYAWWTKEYSDEEISLFYAAGWGGQKILIFPEANAVVVFTGGNYTSTVKTFAILEKYIIPALINSEANH
jgi:CubicO group peptidase (beta-lactamase class C family)